MSFRLEIRNRDSGTKKIEKDLPVPPSGRIGPYDLRYWAEREGLEIEYIDNCWVEVPADRRRLLAFLSELYSPHHPFPDESLPFLAADRELVLVAEEF